MHVGLSTPAAHITAVNTQNPADNRSRQPEGTPNSAGGQFAPDRKADGDPGAIAVTRVEPHTAQKMLESYQLAERLADLANERQQKLAVSLAKVEILNQWPTAAKAYLYRDYEQDDDDLFHVERVIDGDGATLFDAAGRPREAASAADGFLADVTEVDYTDYEYDEVIGEFENTGAATVLDLTTIDTDAPDAADIISVHTLDTRNMFRVLNVAADQVGQVIIPASMEEFEHYLDEEPETLGISEDTGAKLDAKYGNRDAALRALIDTRAFLAFDEEASEIVHDAKNQAVLAAIEEALA